MSPTTTTDRGPRGGGFDSPDPARQAVRRGVLLALGLADIGAERPPGLRATFRGEGLSWYPLVSLGLLAVVDTFQRYGFAVLAPDVSRTLGVGVGAIAGLLGLQTAVLGLAPLAMAALAQRRSRRALICVVSAVAWSCFAIAGGLVTTVWALAAVLLANAISTGSVHALHQPLLLDTYPAGARVRVLTAYHGADAAGNVIAPLLVALLAAQFELTWRGVFIVLGMASLGASFAAAGLRDPGFGGWDERLIRATVRTNGRMANGDGAPPADDTSTRLGFQEIVRRLLLVPTVRRLLVGYAVFGVLLVPFQTFLFFFLEERWNLGTAQRGMFFAYTAVASICALAAFGRRAEQAFHRAPGSVVRVGALLLGIAVLLICVGSLSPWFWPMVVLLGVAHALLTLLRPATYPALLSVVPSHMRPHASALVFVALGGVGGLFGAMFLGGIERRFGVGGAMVAVAAPGLAAAAVIASASKFVTGDLDRMIDGFAEEEEIRQAKVAGTPPPLLACRGIDFSYDQLQVLFDVDFTVDDGEMVALLGVNGAGKSTLLRVVSGLGLPTAGSVRLAGSDITYLDAERRVSLGITQVPGGRAVARSMTVAENLRSLGYSLGRDRRRLDDAIERCFAEFPRLFERRDQTAATLSGGEQQMLALSKALILRPRLLLIDELSLGLAPIVVEQLLRMVRTINAEGAAVVLVEQSVNVALNLVDHAYFMEKGEIRFDGPARELLTRDDLLRAVFLEGADGQRAGGRR